MSLSNHGSVKAFFSRASFSKAFLSATFVSCIALPSLTLVSPSAFAQQALDKAFEAVGGKRAVNNLKTLSIEASGSTWNLAEQYNPGSINVDPIKYRVKLQYDIAGDRLRADYERDRLGFLDLSADERQANTHESSQIINGKLGALTGTDNVFGAGDQPMPSDRWAAARKEQDLLNPHLLLRKAAMYPESLVLQSEQIVDGKRYQVVEIPSPGYPIKLYVDAESGRIAKAHTVENDILLRDVPIQIGYEDWSLRDGGLVFPKKITMHYDDELVFEEARTKVSVNERFKDSLFAFPQGVSPSFNESLAEWGYKNHRSAIGYAASGISPGMLTPGQTNIQAQEISEGIWFVGGASHNSVIVEQSNGIVVIEAPTHEDRSRVLIDWIGKNIPGKKVTHVIGTHHHHDHVAGIRTFVAETDAEIVVHHSAKELYQDVLSRPSTVKIDPLYLNPKTAKISTVSDNKAFKINDAKHPVFLAAVPNQHAEDMLLPYVGGEHKVIYTADLVMGMGGKPSRRSELGGAKVYDVIKKHDWQVDTIVPTHGGVMSYEGFED